MSLKERISSPLEAGPSVLDAAYLPSRLTDALEYASSRLVRKSLHINLVVIKKEYQIPASSVTLISTPTTPASPPLSERFTKHFAKWTRHGSTPGTPRSAISSPAVSEFSVPRSPWPLSPSTPMSPMPATPSTVSSVATDCSTASNGGVDIRLMYADDVGMRGEKILQTIMDRAARKFGIPSFSQLIKVSGLMSRLVHSSIAQNDILFFSDGISLVSLDRLYSLKCALSSYSKTHYYLRLEDAVDDLRRYVLANGGRQVSKIDLLRSYDWLSVSTSTLNDLDRMYRRAYGGADEVGGMSGMMCSSSTQVDVPSMIIVEEPQSEDVVAEVEVKSIPEEPIGVPVSTTPIPVHKPSPKGPLLKLQTNFDQKPKLENEKGEEEDDRTARPSAIPRSSLQPWNSSIDQILSAGANPMSPQRTSVRQGPMTPNGYDDISPITRGEWGFLTTDDSFQGAKRVAVETF